MAMFGCGIPLRFASSLVVNIAILLPFGPDDVPVRIAV